MTDVTDLKPDLRTAAPAVDGLDAVRRIVGDEAVLTSLAQRTFYSTDIAGRGETAAAIVKVADLDILSRLLAECDRTGRNVTPRGGGFSYTGGYTPSAPDAILLDLRPMDRIVEINLDDMYVVVEAGCTWRALYEALKAKGVRTPYFGPMSGYRATVGGALSQGSLFLGSTQFGLVSDSVLSLEVVLADGSVLRTGSWGSNEAVPPFLRQYGPDLTGLFLSDTGAMGVKTKAALKLIPFPARQAYATVAFSTHRAALSALSAIGRAGLAAECYCWDPFFVRLMAAASTGVKQDLGLLWNVVRNGSNLLDGLGAAVRLAFAGRRDFKGDTWLLHVVIDDASGPGAAAKLKQAKALAGAAGGRSVSPSAPRTLRGTPFIDFNTPERRSARRNLPVNSLSPHSRAKGVADDIYGFLKETEAERAGHGIECGVIFFAVGQQAVCIEPLIYWDDEAHRLHDRVDETSDLERLSAFAGPPDATPVALQLRERLKTLFLSHGCAHVQIARSYSWAETRSPEALALLTACKDAVDPKRLMNRGALGFGGPPA